MPRIHTHKLTSVCSHTECTPVHQSEPPHSSSQAHHAHSHPPTHIQVGSPQRRAHVQVHSLANPRAQAKPQELTHKKASTQKTLKHQQGHTCPHIHAYTLTMNTAPHTPIRTHTHTGAGVQVSTDTIAGTQTCCREHTCTHTVTPSHTQPV